MTTVKLINPPVNTTALISFAARTCYSPEIPQLGETIDIKDRVWETGHHTTFQHASSYYSFAIEGIAVGDITLGLHLTTPFYNSSQRSGRFCSKMFSEPDFGEMRAYIKSYWPDLSVHLFPEIMSYLEYGYSIYNSNFEKAIERARRFIKEERPNANEKYLRLNAPKIAQEQLRVFIPVVFPTALLYTINLSALAALYKVAWSPVLKDVTKKMASLVVEREPSLEYLFSRTIFDTFPYNCIKTVAEGVTKIRIEEEPKLRLLSFEEPGGPCILAPDNLYPLDLLHFNPLMMEGNTAGIKTEIEISLATMGQDQRHRTIKRGLPGFTGAFYLPPIPSAMDLDKEALQMMKRWVSFLNEVEPSLGCLLAPYGAMVRYKKVASYNAALHELSKRLCWCSQEEIYHLARFLRKHLTDRVGKDYFLLQAMCPNCISAGKCGEGNRYCGRDLTQLRNNPFPKRCA